MKSIILCEGSDDLWFIAYYLHKTAGWDVLRGSEIKRHWKNYQVNPLNEHQQVCYLKKDGDLTCIWCVGGKDCFAQCLKICVEKFVKEFPFDAVGAVVPVRDRDDDTIADILRKFETPLSEISPLQNQQTTEFHVSCYGEQVSVKVTPVIIPFAEQGAIESLLIASVRDDSEAGKTVAQSAEQFVDALAEQVDVRERYLPHKRQILKAKFSAVVAITNPEHSTARFQDMVVDCPWEQSPSVREHFDVIRHAVTSIP